MSPNCSVTWWRLACAALAVAALAACSTPQPAAPQSNAPDAVADLVAGLEAPRYLAVRRSVEVVLRNEGDHEIRVAGLQLDAAAFAAVTTTARDVVVRAGGRVDVPVPYGEARCPRFDADAGVVLDIEGAGPVRVPLVGSEGVIRRLHEGECLSLAVAAAADIGFGATWTAVETPDGPAVEGRLTIRRRSSDQRIAIDAAEGGINFTITPVGTVEGPLLVVEPGESQGSRRIHVRATRCDPHALAENKKTFRFPVWVALGNEAGQYLEVEPTGRGRELLQANLDDCGERYRADHFSG